MPQGVSRELYDRTACELRGERALRRGWEAECRRMAVSNRELRLTVRILRAEVAALRPGRLEEVA